MANDEVPVSPFDFAEHESTAISAYLKVRPFYADLATVVARILEECVKKRGIKVHSVEHRAKEPTSFGRKAAIPSEGNPNSPKYSEPLKQITDLAAIRIITFFPDTVNQIDRLVQDEFDIVERSDKGRELIEEERFGYQSIHFLVRLSSARARLAEYERFAGAVAEVQVRTIMQHAWAEIEHDIQYKSATSIPVEIRRRFMALAGMLEIFDREFQAIQNEDRELADLASDMVQRGNLGGVEITPDTLKLFLDRRLGPDERIRDWSYDWTTRLLKRLGFRDLKQVQDAIAAYDDDALNGIAYSTRQGQLTRFELLLLAALGERFIEGHHWGGKDWFQKSARTLLEKLRANGIEPSTFDPVAALKSSNPH